MNSTKIILLSSFLIGTTILLNGDDFPEMTTFSEDGTILKTSGVADDGFYDISVIRDVYLEFENADFWALMEEDYNTEDRELATMTVDDKVYEGVGVQFKGNTSYRNLGESLKASFDIRVDWTIEDQDIKGYETLNFNNAFEDDSMMREVLYSNKIATHIPAAKANFINLYINGENWGVYSNVEQLNKDFLKEWYRDKGGDRWRALAEADFEGPGGGAGPGMGGPPMGGGGPGGGGQWGNGLSALNYLGDAAENYTPYYTLKSDYEDENAEEQAWLKLATVTKILANTPDESLYETLNAVFDIDRALWFLAMENIFSDDDSYVYKGTMDYYLYVNPETDRMVPLEYDGNSVLGSNAASWSIFMNSDDSNYPLLSRLLNLTETRQRYLAHARTILEDVMVPDAMNTTINAYDELIGEAVSADPIKDGTYSDYVSAISSLKSIIEFRCEYLTSETELMAEGVEVGTVSFASQGETNRRPDYGETVTVTASIETSTNLQSLNLYYLNGTNGVYTKVTMSDDGRNGDGVANDGNYAAQIPGFESGTYVRYYVESVSNNSYASRAYFPAGAEHETYVYRVNPVEETAGVLVINEIMASNETILVDEFDEFDDWVECYNNSVLAVNLKGYYLSDDFSEPTKWQFPDVTIGAGGYLVIWIDDDEEDQGELHASFKLSKEGEELLLSDPDGNPVDFIEFGAQETDISYGRAPNGTGAFQSLTPTPGSANPNM